MHVILTSPLGCSFGGFRGRFYSFWERAAYIARTPTLRVAEPTRTEHHGALLTRIWTEEIKPRLTAKSPEDVLVSELDFLPYPNALISLRHTTGFVFPQYVTRNYSKLTDDVTQDPGKLTRHTIDVPSPDPACPPATIPLTGPWLMRFPAGSWAKKMPRDWLDAAGPFNDAANLAYARLLAEQILDIPVTILPGDDLHPLAWGTDYPGLGQHLFWARTSDQDGDDIVGYPLIQRPLRASDIRRSYRRACAAMTSSYEVV